MCGGVLWHRSACCKGPEALEVARLSEISGHGHHVSRNNTGEALLLYILSK